VKAAKAAWPHWKGTAPMPADDKALIREVLDAVQADHPQEADYLDSVRGICSTLSTFVTEKDIVGMPSDPLRIIYTPDFLRSSAGAFCMSPGPLEIDRTTFYCWTPIPPESGAEERESYMREENWRTLRLLSIHEAVPGHYVQLCYAAKCASQVRLIFDNSVFAEGWAVWVTQCMIDEGYEKDDPAMQLAHWKFYQRSVHNSIIDIGIHLDGMTREEVIRLLVEDGFQEPAEAAAKWQRASLGSTQLCCYFLGCAAFADIIAKGKQRAADEGRAWKLRQFLEEGLLAHGSPSIRIINEILFGKA